MLRASVLILLAIPSFAAGQVVEGCVMVGGDLMCPPRRTGDATADAINDLTFGNQVRMARAAADRQRDAEERARASAARQTEASATAEAEESYSIPQRIGSLIAAGDCAGAMNLALTSGELDLAAKVKVLCAPPK
jgi:hypothetical protein